ncbi:MAG: GNAT family N-acetyltransferase [Planctomycetota bacterium]
MSDTYRIRGATLDDADVLARFNGEMARETEAKHLDPAVVADGVRTLLGDPTSGFYLVAETDGDVVGSLMVTSEWSDWRNGHFWWVQSVYVAPAHRRRGVYRRLYAAVKERATVQGGVCGIRLYVEAGNEAARDAYERLGMTRTNYRLYEELLPRESE